MFDMRPDEWLLAAAGDYQSAAAQTMKNDGSNLQNVVIVEWPARVNNSDEFRTVRLAMSPEDAAGLAEVLAHSAAFFVEPGGVVDPMRGSRREFLRALRWGSAFTGHWASPSAC